MEEKYALGGSLSASQIQDAIKRSNVKPEEILSKEVNTDTPKKLNRSEAVVPIDVINEIENQGVSIERLESLGLPVYKYQTQITIHGIFEGLTKERVGGYKNLTLNQNKTLGIRYNAIDLKKKETISKALRLDKTFNEDSAKGSFYTNLDSKGYTLIKSKTTSDKAQAIEYAKQFKEEADTLPYSFIGGKYVNIYNIYGMYYVQYSIYLNAIRQESLWGFISAITDGRINEETYTSLLLQKELKDKQAADDYQKELDVKNKIAAEKVELLKSESPFTAITELPNSKEFTIASVISTYSGAGIKVYYIFYNKQNRRVYRKETYSVWSEVLLTINKEPTYSQKNLLMGDVDLERLGKLVAKGGYFLVSEVSKPLLVIEEKKVITKPQSYMNADAIYSNDVYDFVETKHTKTGDTIYVLRVKPSLSRDEFKKVDSNVKLISGYYSGFVKGFIIKSEISENEILRLFEGTSLAVVPIDNVNEIFIKKEKFIFPEILKKVMPIHQQILLSSIGYSENEESLNDLAKNVESLKERNDNGKDSIMYLHYFQGNQDWYISEWDKENQTFYGFANIGYDSDAEFGSSYVKDLVNSNKIELDFYFEPTAIKNINVGGNFYYEEEQALKEKLIGGKADGKNIEDIANMHSVSLSFANEQLEKGILVESEHTNDKEKAAEIAKDHLTEFINYYIKLEKMEDELKSEEQVASIENKNSNILYKFNVGEYIAIIDAIKSNENIHEVISHGNYNNSFGWETTIKNLFTDEQVTMFENLLELSDRNNEIQDSISELKKSFPAIDNKTLNLHLKIRLVAVSEEKELALTKENYPIVIEWRKGLDYNNGVRNIGLNNIDELNAKLTEAGFTNEPTVTYIKNKVWIKGYPSYIIVYNSESAGDFNFNKQHIRDWLKKYDTAFDFSIYDTNKNDLNAAEVPDSEIEDLEMLIELTEDTLSENPSEDTEMYLELLKSTLEDLKNK